MLKDKSALALDAMEEYAVKTGASGAAVLAYAESGVIITAFSGSAGEIDYEIAEYGLSKVVDKV